MPSVSPSTWMSEVIARHPQNQHLHNNLHVMKGMYNLLLKSNLKLASPGPDCILACWYVSILNLHNSIGIVFTCHVRGIAQFIMAEFPTQHPAHTQGCTHGSRKGIHSLLALATLVHFGVDLVLVALDCWCFLPRQTACCGKGLG